jgi:hypothetical protein
VIPSDRFNRIMGAGADTSATSSAEIRMFDKRVFVKFQINFAQYAMRTGIYTFPACLTGVGIKLDILGFMGVRQRKTHNQQPPIHNDTKISYFVSFVKLTST